jgi:hypothetical protein
MEVSLRLDAIEDYLGSPATRFFSAGYRRVTHEIVDLHATPADAESSGIRATVTVRYPSDWSRKRGEMDILPHLSSVDMVVLGAQLAEAHLTHAFGLGPADRRQLRLERVSLRAGTQPQEELAELAASATLRMTTPVAERPGRWVSVYRCTIGAMRARLEIEHGIARRATAGAVYGSVEEMLGPASARYYGDGFTLGRHAISNVGIDMDALRGYATAGFGSVGRIPTEGVDGALQPSVTVVDCFVVSLQLVQVLLYELDAVARQDSETLWMLSTVLEAAHVPLPRGPDVAVRAAIACKRLIELNGRVWRNVDVEAECGGVRLRCSLAHRLPHAAGRDAALASASV